MQDLLHLLVAYGKSAPVELFVFVGSFIEELISPIPSFLVFLPAGAMVETQGINVWYILVLAVIAAAGRVMAGLILYWLSGHFRVYLFAKKGSWFGITKEDIEAFRTKLDGRWGWWAIFAAWALPIFPGAPISLTCGFIHMPVVTFMTSTFAGSIINATIYLYIGYYGLKALGTLNTLEFAGQLVVCGLLIILIAWMVRRHFTQTKRKRKAAL